MRSTKEGEGVQPSQARIIEEKISTRAIDALMSNYRDPQQAFLELIDNAIDNRAEGKTLAVRIRITKDELSVYNQGGNGLDFEGLQNFFVWGYSEKIADKIGFYGVGGKAAMGYLGRSMEVVCSPKNKGVEYRVHDPLWELRPEGELKKIEAEERKTTIQDGYFRARVTNLKREVSRPALIARLADIYRPLLLDGSVELSVNGIKVEPLEIKYLETDPNLLAKTFQIQTRFGDWIDIKVGVLEEGQRTKAGIRCYYRGRLIEDEQFFGLPTPAQMPQMSRFIGEAHMNFVPVTTNKNSFDKGSVQYQDVAQRIRRALEPWVAKMAQLKIEQRSKVESFERELAREAKRVLEHVFANTGLITKGMLPGESVGRRPPSRREQPVVSTLPTNPGGPGPQEGQTAPVITATIGEMKRWGALFAWEVFSMGTSSSRSEVVQENGKNILRINSDYPLYQATKKAGEDALRIYLAETGIMKICEIVTKGRSIDDYVDLADQLLRECGAVYQQRIRDGKSKRS